jgi:hypothetical protein
MRYPASEKLEIIRLVYTERPPVKKRLEQYGRMQGVKLDLSRFGSDLGFHLSGLSFACQGALPSES